MSATSLAVRAVTAARPTPATSGNNIVPPGVSLGAAYAAEPGPNRVLELLEGGYGEGERITVRSGESLSLLGLGPILTELQGTIVVNPGGALYLEHLAVRAFNQGHPAIFGAGHIHSRGVQYLVNNNVSAALVPSGTAFLEDITVLGLGEGEGGILIDCSSAAHVEIRGTLLFESPTPDQVISFGAATTVQGEAGAIESSGGGIRIVGPLNQDGQDGRFRLGALRVDTNAPVGIVSQTVTELSAIAFVGFSSPAAEGAGTYILRVESAEVSITTDMDSIAGPGAHIIAATDQEGGAIDDLTAAGITLRIGQLVVSDRLAGGGNNWTKIRSFTTPILNEIEEDPLNT